MNYKEWNVHSLHFLNQIKFISKRSHKCERNQISLPQYYATSIKSLSVSSLK